MSSLRAIALSAAVLAAVLAAVGCSAQISGPAKTYRLARRATVILMDMSNGPVPAHYGVAAFIKLLRATPELSLERGGLDPHFRTFKTTSVNPSDGTEITTLSRHYHP